MFVKKAEYDEEVRRDDVNFWRTTNDDVPSHYKQNKYPATMAGHNSMLSNRNQNQYNGPIENEPGELAGDSSFQPLKRDNVYNLWLNNPQESDFFKNPRKQQQQPQFNVSKNDSSANNSAFNRSSAVRIKKPTAQPGAAR